MLEIVTAAADGKLTTVAAVKAELAITGAEHDGRLDALIEQYSAAIVSWCGRSFALETVRETIFEPRAVDGLLLDRLPIVSVSAITIDGETVAPTDCRVDPASGTVSQIRPVPHGEFWPRGETIVTYSAGYVLPGAASRRTLPRDVERAAILLVRDAHHAAARDPLLRSVAVEGIDTVTYFAGGGEAVPIEVQSLLSGYRRLNVG